MDNCIYAIVGEYRTVNLLGAAIYYFLEKNESFNDDIIIAHQGLSNEDKEFLSRLYYKIQFKEYVSDIDIDGKKISDGDETLLPENLINNAEVLHDFEEWKVKYFFNDEVFFPKRFDISDKYVVYTCAKGENDYIVEWIEHYLNLGFDKIIICDNNDDDSLKPIVNDYVGRGVVEIFNCKYFSYFQQSMFQMFCLEGNYKWCAYFDCDEFLELEVYSNIKDYLATKDEDCVAFNWVLFGSDGQINKRQGKLSERFKVPYLPILSIYNGFLKGILRGGRYRFRDIEFIGGHLPCPNEKSKKKNTFNIGGYFIPETAPYQTSYPLRYKEGYIKHYYTKSFEEWLDKAKRGWPLNTESLPFYRYFLLQNRLSIPKNLYEKNLFMGDDWFKKNAVEILDFLKNRSIVEIIRDKASVYGVTSFILYIMSQVNGKIILIKDAAMDDMLFTTLLEYAFVTGNRVVFCKDDEEVNMAFCRYGQSFDSEYFWRVM